MAESTSLDATLKLLQQLSGKGSTTTTSGGTSTKQTMLSQDTLNATLKSALESNQGLAALAAGQANTGMYNSTVNQQMTNDLLARLTTNAAVAGAPKVTTTPKSTVTSKEAGGMNNLLIAAGLGYGKKGIDKLLSGGFWEDSASSAVSSGANTALDFIDTNTLAGVEAASGGGSSLIDSITSMFGGSAIETGVGSGFDSALWGLGTGADAASEVVVEGAGTSFLEEISPTIICTESARQGLLDVSKFKAEISKLLVTPLNPYISSGYHFLAAPVVARMKKSKRVAKFFAKWAEAYIDGDVFSRRGSRYYFIKLVLFPICYLIGRIKGKESASSPC